MECLDAVNAFNYGSHFPPVPVELYMFTRIAQKILMAQLDRTLNTI